MAELVEAAPRKDSILILGGGAFTLPQHFAEQYPNAQIDVVEIDPGLVDIAKQYFNYKSPDSVQVIAQDARAYLNTNAKQYDVVLVDVYSELSIPFSLSTAEYASSLRKATKSGGFVAANIIGSNKGVCGDLLHSMHAAYASQFTRDIAYPLVDTGMQAIQNIITVYSNTESSWLPTSNSVHLHKGQMFTDNFAPVEHLKQQCISASAAI